ncbi:MAG: T9SS type A sorting domain-containing protein, partial [Candidatus Zixiibacteriota bacterium]
ILTCPPDTTFDCVMGDAGTATAIDNCDPDPVISYADTTVNERCPFTFERTWSATDSCGNVSYCVQTITIQDVDAPIITCPPDTTFDCVMGDAGTATATDNCDPNPQISYSDFVDNASCPLIILRTWTATDSCGNSEECTQTITVQDTTAPVITCPPDTTFDCVMGDAGTATATDNCDPDPEISYSDYTLRERCPIIIQRTWTATDSCGNDISCEQIITIQDVTPPSLTCPPDTTFDCVMGDAGTPIVWDNCDPNPVVNYSDSTVNASCPLVIARTWTATDSCDNVSSCVQIITVQDVDPPLITCADDVTIGCNDTVEFTPPEATDNCDPNPTITMVYTDIPDGPGVYRRGWIATDYCGNSSDTCYQTVTVEPCPCTFTIGGWGTECPDQGQADWHPGCIRDEYWDDVFGVGGSVSIGHASGFTATWTSSQAVADFLPDGSTPGVLDSNYVDPLTTPAGVLASQILGLRLNVEYSCAGIFSILGVPTAGECLGDILVPESCANGLFTGLTVYQFLAVADSVVAGLTVSGVTPSDVNYTATCLNELHSDCDPFPYTSSILDNKANNSARPSTSQIPTVFSLGQNYPNPFNPITEFEFGIPTATHVTLDVFNIMGQKVTRLVDGYHEPGMYNVIWNGTNASSGVYFYRIEAGDYIETRKMLLLK